MKKRPAIEVRPIGARALKSATDTLRPYLSGARVLDLYSGQGRFGLAAAKEGAESVTFVEIEADRVRAIQEELRKKHYQGRAYRSDVLQFLHRSGDNAPSFNVFFADPPFQFWTEEFGTELFSLVCRIAAPGAIFLVKHPDQVIASFPTFCFRLWKRAAFGESLLLYYVYGELGQIEADGT